MVVVRHLRCRREEWSSLHGFALRASPAVTHGVSPPGTVGAGWEVSLFSPSPLSTLHGFALRASPAVTHSVSPQGAVGAGWEVSLFSLSPLIHGFALRASPAVTHSVSPSGDRGWTMSYFFSYQEKQTLGRSVFSHSCGLICRAQKYNKGVS